MAEPILAPNSSWFSQGGTTVTRNSITEIEIVDSYTPTGNETASWDASEALDGSVMAYVTGTKLTIAGNGSGCIYANPDSERAFNDINKTDYFFNLTNISGLNLLDVSRATTMRSMFNKCKSLTAFTGLENWNTSNVTSMRAMFQNCESITSLAGVADWDTSKVTSMQAMFYQCTSLTSLLEISGWDTSSVENMSSMFCGNSYVGDMKIAELDVSNWDVSNVKMMNHMFYGCSKLTELDLSKWNTSKVFDMNHLFCDCWSLTSMNLANWDVSNCQAFYAMFNDCNKLTTIDLTGWNTQSARTFAQMFERCSSLTKIIGLENFVTTTLNVNTPVVDVDGNVVEVSYVELFEMFSGCSSLTKIDLSSFDTRNVHNTEYMFLNCTNLKTVYVSDLWSTESVTESTDMFKGCTSLVGEDGTVYDSNQITVEYARVDNGTNAPGYLTHIHNKDGNAVLVQSKSLYQTAKAIRDASGTTDKYKPSEMAVAIRTLAKPDAPIVGDPVAQIGDTTYTSVSDALSAAQAGETVILIADAVDDNVTIPSDVTLELGTYQLTANSVTGLYDSKLSGTRYEGATSSHAKLIVPRMNLRLPKVPKYDITAEGVIRSVVPIWTGEYYVFATARFSNARITVTDDNDGTSNVTYYYILNKDVRSLCGTDGTRDNGIQVYSKYKHTKSSGAETKELQYTTSLEAKLCETYEMYFTLAECNKYADLKIMIEVRYDCGIVDSLEYTYADYVTTE